MKEELMFDFQAVLSEFGMSGSCQVTPYGSGHINDTFLVNDGISKRLLQRINHQIFKQVPELMDNILKVTNALKAKAPELVSLEIYPSKNGIPFVCDAAGNYWRLLRFIADSQSYDRISDPKLAFEAGRVTGQFHRLLDGFDATELHVTLPNFHHMGLRLDRFYKAVQSDKAQRAHMIPDLIDFVNDRAYDYCQLDRLIADGTLPVRVVHNDPKINNILFNTNDKGICMIDLDTLMPGCLLHDFGDAIRTTANNAEEDERDTQKVSINLDLFEAYVKGFLNETAKVLKQAEIEYLAFSAQVLTFIIGLRFLTDYVEGDQYFKIAFAEHNLRRAKAQFALVESMEVNKIAMNEVVMRCYKELV
jgi:Ser/Thr protein kinase RdoA (MazF antagonist)